MLAKLRFASPRVSSLRAEHRHLFQTDGRMDWKHCRPGTLWAAREAAVFALDRAFRGPVTVASFAT